MSSGMESGISGWLSPEGKFIPAEYGTHDKMARLLEEAKILKPLQDKENSQCIAHGERLFELLGYIKFVYRKSGVFETESYVFFPQQFGYKGNITNEQVQWIEDKFDTMTELQKWFCNKYLKYCYSQSA